MAGHTRDEITNLRDTIMLRALDADIERALVSTNKRIT